MPNVVDDVPVAQHGTQVVRGVINVPVLSRDAPAPTSGQTWPRPKIAT